MLLSSKIRFGWVESEGFGGIFGGICPSPRQRSPQTSIAEARQQRDDARAQIEKDIDPGNIKKAQKAAETQETETFEVRDSELQRL